MRTLFRKLMVPLLFFIGAFAASSASATLYTVTEYQVFKSSNGGDAGYLLAKGPDCVPNDCYFQFYAVGASMVMALATAKQMGTAVVYLHGPSVDGSGIYSLADSGKVVQAIELLRNPATFGAISPETPISIYAVSHTTEFYATCVPIGSPGCRSGGLSGVYAWLAFPANHNV